MTAAWPSGVPSGAPLLAVMCGGSSHLLRVLLDTLLELLAAVEHVPHAEVASGARAREAEGAQSVVVGSQALLGHFTCGLVADGLWDLPGGLLALLLPSLLS